MRLDRPKALEGVCRYIEMRFTPSGRPVAHFTLVLNTEGDTVECEAWGDLAQELVTQYDEGSHITVTGSIKEQEYTLNDVPKIRRYFGVREIN
jgi:single-stranded DNA-binding protein